MIRPTRLFAALTIAFSLGTSTSAWTQSLGLGAGGDDKPLEVFADQGIEWHQNESNYVARGNARAVKGDTTVHGDALIAHYRKAASGGTEVWRVEATGNVRITTPTDTAYGDRAVYTIDNAVLVMTGKNLRLTTPRETITARDSLEYWEQKNLAVARGEALVITNDRRIRADVVTALFKSNNNRSGATPATAKPAPQTRKPAANTKPGAKPGSDRDSSSLQRVDAYGNVVITTPQDVARGNRGVYLEETGIANLMGSVKITRGNSQLNGEVAEVNLRTGVSRIISADKGKSGGPVRALIVPERKDGAGSSTATPPTPAPGN